MGGFKRHLGPDATAGRDEAARELDAEVEAHLAMRVDALVAQGLSEEEARAEARRRFGDTDRARRVLLRGVRRARRRRRMRRTVEALATDLRLAVRQARRAPGFAAVAVLIFAAGVGLTTSMFTVADHVLLRPLPYPEPDRLVGLWSTGEQGNTFPWVSMSNWADWKEASSLESAAIHAGHRAAVSTGDDAFHAPATAVAGPFFTTLRLPFVVGRGFSEEEAQAEAPVAVVSAGFWERVLGAPVDLTGTDLVVDGVRRSVVGVVPDGQAFPAGTEIWIPEAWVARGGAMRNNINYEAVARLADDATLERARMELDRVARNIREADPEAIYSYGVGVYPLREVLTDGARSYLVMLAVAVAFLLVVACANLAGLSLARARRRARETAVHLALGAGRERLVRRVVTEHVLLSLVGGAGGVVVAWLTTGAMMARVATVVPRANEVGFDVRVAAFGIVAALAAGVAAGLVPALRGSRTDLSRALAGARGGIGGGRGLPGAVMVGTEVALAVTLLVAGGLLLRSFQAVVSRDLGFDPAGVMTADLVLAGSAYEDADRRATFWRSVQERVAALPGVEAVGVANRIPTSNGGRGFIDLEGRENEDIGAGYYVVGGAYFDALDIPTVRGRVFDATDDVGTERVTVVNRTMAERFWPGQDPIGQRVRARSMEVWIFGTPEAPWVTVIGVVEDTRQYGFESDLQTDMYVLDRQVPYHTRAMTLVVESRTSDPPDPGALRQAVRDVDPGVPVEVSSLEGRLARLTGERRLVLAGLGLFGAASVLLVCLGIYGLMSFAAGERTREMAVRAALGAERGGLVRLMLGSALRVVLAGAAVGVFGAWMFTRLLESFLVDVAATDPWTYAAALALLTAVALTAALVPSLKAARGDPLQALRAEG